MYICIKAPAREAAGAAPLTGADKPGAQELIIIIIIIIIIRRLSEISVRAKQASCRYSWKTVFSRLLP